MNIYKSIKEKHWLKEVDSCSLRTSIFNLEDSFKRYKSKISEYPKFNSKIKSRPPLFKGIVSGGIILPIEQKLSPIKDKAILIYHGNEDVVIDVSESIQAYDKLTKLNASNIVLKIIENGNHF